MPDKKWTYPPGTPGGQGQSVTEHEDGSVTVKDADGTETHYDPKTGRATKTPPTPPQVTPPQAGPEVRPDGEVRVGYGGKRIRFIPGPPRRFKIVRSAPDTPREEDFNLRDGTRGVVQQQGGEKVETPPTSPTPEELPTTHPKPAESPKPAGGESAPGKKKPKKKKRVTPRGKKRPKTSSVRKPKKRRPGRR